MKEELTITDGARRKLCRFPVSTLGLERNNSESIQPFRAAFKRWTSHAEEGVLSGHTIGRKIERASLIHLLLFWEYLFSPLD